ncbi:hypothetical protein KSP40_PGU020402 [Platanthera guangdongensis]|uniref:Uncharacterized protein n=1 Tax=Platanthera guangdongensis TaxID=2320717 RepID=A0ABR2N2D0_9ASPA
MDKEAKDSYQSFLDRQFRAHPATCNVLLETVLKHNKVADTHKLFGQMLDEHKSPVFMLKNSLRNAKSLLRWNELVEDQVF